MEIQSRPRKIIAILLMILFSPPHLGAAVVTHETLTTATFCPDEQTRHNIQQFYQEKPGALPILAKRALQTTPAAIASSLPNGQAVLVPGSEFRQIWEMLAGWEDLMFLIIQDGHILELKSTIPSGEVSSRSNYYNLDDGTTLGGHLRPNNVGAIAATTLPDSKGGAVRFLSFFNTAGESSFEIIVSGPERSASPDDISRFDALVIEMRNLPSICP